MRPSRLPPKDAANFLLVSGELNALQGSRKKAKSKSRYDQALSIYRSLGMRHAFISTIILCALHHRVTKSQLRPVRLKAQANGYIVERDAIDALLRGDTPVYTINLS